MNMQTQTSFNRLGLLVLVMAMAGMVAEAETFKSEIREVFTAASGESLSVQVDRGNVEITSQPGDQVTVKIVMSVRAKDAAQADEAFRQVHSELKQSDNQIQVKLRQKSVEGSWFMRLFKRRQHVSTVVSIQCPQNFSVSVKAGSGNILVEDISGQLSMYSGSGNIVARQLQGEIRADTGSGNIDFLQGNGFLEANTGSGNISVSQFTGKFQGATGSGNIEADGSFSRVKANTGSGNVVIRSESAPVEDWVCRAGSGDIHIHLPQQAAFFLEANTSSGKIRNAFPVADSQSTNKRRLHAKINEGGPVLKARSGSGDVTISIR